MVRKIGQIIRRGPSTWLVRIYVGRDSETRTQVRGQIHSWWAAVRTSPPQPHARGTRSRSKHPFIPTNRRSIPRSLARHLCQAKASSQELSRLLEAAGTVRPSASRFAIVWRAFASGNSDALQRVAEPEALATHHLLYTCGSVLGLETGGPLETPPNEPGRGCPSASAITAAFHRVRCRPGEAVHRCHFWTSVRNPICDRAHNRHAAE